MSTIKGFMGNQALVVNTPGTVAQFGELSTRSLTFSREKGYYESTGIPNIRFISFSAKDDSNAKIVVPTNVKNHLLAVGDYIYGRYNAGTITTVINDLIADMLAEFNTGTITISAVVINELVVDAVTPTKRLPDSIQWTLVDSSDSSTHHLTVWFSDVYFQLQYDEFEIVVVPPLLPEVDAFYNTNANVGIALNGINPKTIIDAVDIAMGTDPYTILVSTAVVWHEHNNFGSGSRTVYWTTIIYGDAGNTPENIRLALRDYLSDNANTALTVDKWEEMFPTIFESNEYFVVPLWNRVMGTVPTIIYSPISKPGGSVQTAKNNVPFTALDIFWNQYLAVTTSIYQDISVLLIGAPTNTASNDFDFTLKYPDYLNIPLSHPDSNRMSPDTIGFVTFLATLLEGASRLTATTPHNQIPTGFTRVIRSGKIYLSGNYGGTQFYAVSKNSFAA